jgi:carbamoyltransferase
VVVNTSFNVRGEPIVCTPEDAYRCFLATEMDALVLEDVVLVKDASAPAMLADERERHLQQFTLD